MCIIDSNSQFELTMISKIEAFIKYSNVQTFQIKI